MAFVKGSLAPASTPPPGARPAVDSGPLRPTDLRWKEVRDGARFHATLGSSRLLALPLLAFGAAWNGFLYVWYRMAFQGGGGPSGVMLWVPLLHVVAGIVVVYFGLCLLVNSAHARFEGDYFTFRRGPLPELGGVRVAIDDLRGFSVQATRVANRVDDARVWDAIAETKDGRAIRLKLAQPNPEEAEYIVWHLQLALDRAQHPRLESYRG